MRSKILIWVIGLFLAGGVVLAYGDVEGRASPRIGKHGPTLLYPVTDHISLKGKKSLRFKWERTDLALTNHFIFKLYKGYGASTGDLIFQKDFYVSDYPIETPASLLKKGQVYTWVLVQVFYDGRKGEASYSSFKIVSK